MKRKTRWMMAALLAVGLLAGCGQEHEQKEPEKDETVSDVPDDTSKEEGHAPEDEGQWYAKGDEIEGQCFDVELEPVGEVSFRAYDPGEEAGKYGDAVFLIWKNGVIWQQLEGMTRDNVREGRILESVDAVSFGDYNQDGWDDILVISTYTDSQEEPGSEVRYYEGGSQGNFALMRELSETMTDELSVFTIAGARDYLETEFGLQKPGQTETDAGEGALDVARQLDLITAERKLWRGEEEYVDYSYMVADLDQNGRLEIINASIQGTGLFTYAKCYEVNSEGTGLEEVLLDVDAADYSAWPDFIVEEAPVYYDSASSLYWYATVDFMRNGAAENVTIQTIMAKEQGTVREEFLAADHVTATENSESHTYYDGAEAEISLGEYEKAVEERCAGMEKKTAQFGWLYMKAGEVDSYSEEELRQKLGESWDGFKIS